MSKTYTPTQELLNLPLDERIRWAEALESGEYEQARKELVGSDGSLCCLAVWEVINGTSVDMLAESSEDACAGHEEMPSCLLSPHKIGGELPQNLLIATWDGEMISPWKLNDKFMFTFPEIAQILRGNEVVK